MSRFFYLVAALIFVQPVLADSPAKVRSDGDRLPEGARVRLRSTRFRVPVEIQELQYSGGSKPRTGSLRFQHDQQPWALRYLGGGKTLLSVSGGDLFLWEAASGKLRRKQVLEEPAGGGWGVAVSPNGRLVATSGWSKLSVHDLNNGKTVAELPETEWNWSARCFSPDNNTLAVLCNEKNLHVRFYDVHSAREIRRSPLLPEVVRDTNSGREPQPAIPFALLFSPDGKYLAILNAAKSTFCVWQPGNQKILRTPPRQVVQSGPLVFSPDGKDLAFIARATDRGKAELVLWDPAGGKTVHILGVHAGASGSLLFSPDGKHLASLAAGGVRRWDLATRKELPTVKIARPLTMVFSPNSRFVAAQAVGAVYLIDLRNGRRTHEWECAGKDPIPPPDPNESADDFLEANSSFWDELRGYGSLLAFSPDSKVLAAIYNRGIRRWEVESGKEIVANTKQKGADIVATGYIGFQDHGLPLWLRNIRVRELK